MLYFILSSSSTLFTLLHLVHNATMSHCALSLFLSATTRHSFEFWYFFEHSCVHGGGNAELDLCFGGLCTSLSKHTSYTHADAYWFDTHADDFMLLYRKTSRNVAMQQGQCKHGCKPCTFQNILKIVFENVLSRRMNPTRLSFKCGLDSLICCPSWQLGENIHYNCHSHQR